MKYRQSRKLTKQKNTRALLRFALLALVVAVVGTALAYGTNRLIEAVAQPVEATAPTVESAAQPAAPESQHDQAAPVWRWSGHMIGVATILAVVGVLFFGFRAYFMGVKVHHTAKRPRQRVKAR